MESSQELIDEAVVSPHGKEDNGEEDMVEMRREGR